MTTTAQTGPATSRPTGFWAHVPRGARLEQASFVSRHRIISAVLAVHPPVLAAICRIVGLSGGTGMILVPPKRLNSTTPSGVPRAIV